jgi:ubiquinone/menaquinone biosynthesis C-methylase UbiE
VGFYDDRILPRIIDVACGTKEMSKYRARATAGLAGDVLEVGFGSGLNLPHYPPEVTSVKAVDPATEGRKLAAGRIAEFGLPVEFVGLDGADLALDDASVDHVLITMTMCTIPDVGGALAEIRRVLRPGGQLHFLEHGRSPDPAVAKWQDRLTPLQKRVFGGCHLNRPVDRLVDESGLETARLENFQMKGPKAIGYMYEGVAVRPA